MPVPGYETETCRLELLQSTSGWRRPCWGPAFEARKRDPKARHPKILRLRLVGAHVFALAAGRDFKEPKSNSIQFPRVQFFGIASTEAQDLNESNGKALEFL